MYKRHTHFHSLSNEDAVIWKYMDIFKYLNLIETASLYFMRVDKYEDKYDGFMPELTDPDKPKSSKQRYVLTALGKRIEKEINAD